MNALGVEGRAAGEHATGQAFEPHAGPQLLDPVELRRVGRQEQRRYVARSHNFVARVPPGAIEDLLARINLWTFALPSLRERLEDIEPNLEYELAHFERRTGRSVRFSTEARAAYVRFATGREAQWKGNFCDLSASITRLATLSPAGRITEEAVRGEIARLRAAWTPSARDRGKGDACAETLGEARANELDRFDRVQLADVLEVCRASTSLSEAGRTLFAASRARKTSSNDADRLRKYLTRFGVTWEMARRA